MDFLETYAPLHPKQRLGRAGDGGYVCIDDGHAYDLFLSCGLGDDVSFDAAFLAAHPDIPAYAVDGTVERPSALPERATFIKKNIAPYESEGTTNLYELLAAHKNVFLKMDIEGFEWGWFDAMPAELLANIRQIVVEFHGMINSSWQAGPIRKRRVLAKLAGTHTLVHVHGNNTAGARYYRGCIVPYVVELTYLRKDAGHAGRNTQSFPVAGLDFPNDPTAPEISLTGYPFVNI